jgi:hypothetical protein
MSTLSVIMISTLIILTFASISQHPSINIISYAQNSTTATTSPSSTPTQLSQSDQAKLGNLIVTKSIRCDSELGIPSDTAVCKFVLENVDPGQFTITVTGTNSPPTKIQGSVNGTSISLSQGNYTISEDDFDTTDIENQLGETATVTVSATADGDCTPQYLSLDVFKNATGTITDTNPQKCNIINTIEVTAGNGPEEFQQD